VGGIELARDLFGLVLSGPAQLIGLLAHPGLVGAGLLGLLSLPALLLLGSHRSPAGFLLLHSSQVDSPSPISSAATTALAATKTSLFR